MQSFSIWEKAKGHCWPWQSEYECVSGLDRIYQQKGNSQLARREVLIHYEGTNPETYYIKTGGKGALLIEHKANETVAKLASNGETISDIKQIIAIIGAMK